MIATERERQHFEAVSAAARTISSTGSMHGAHVRRFHFVCDDGECFSAIAATEAGAVRVLNSERPGMGARFRQVTYCPVETRAGWVMAQHGLRHPVRP